MVILLVGVILTVLMVVLIYWLVTKPVAGLFGGL